MKDREVGEVEMKQFYEMDINELCKLAHEQQVEIEIRIEPTEYGRTNSTFTIQPWKNTSHRAARMDSQLFMLKKSRKVGEIGMADRADISGIETIKIKRRIVIKAIRCIACDTWECQEYDRDKYEAEIIEEAIGLCESCRKAIEWAKERMAG